ncbi:hypothetical protein BDR03DRAFT_584751 [Suillus americanus]|nr:hypothetical protein BDR03DRAFT_584751 [Suillus americanus]
MDPPTFEFTEAELNDAGLLGDGVCEAATQAIATMKEHQGLLKSSLFTLQCISLSGHHKDPGSPTLSDMSAVSSNLSQYEYERTFYYNGIARHGNHPELVYRSDFLTTPFLNPVGRHAHIPVKSLHGVFDTPLNGHCRS